MEIKEQTRKLAAGCSKHRMFLRLWMKLTKSAQKDRTDEVLKTLF
ncbi:hypothetical protein [Streptococcus pneumoniae]|nr:hypothetical protein [Streptococcus pneumoniae]